MALSIEDMKSLDLVEFLTRYYGMSFRKVGNQHVALSPYTQETEPSFFVNYVDGHWLFKDFSSGYGGSIIDFVQIKEKVSRVNDAIQYIRKLLSSEEIANFESRKSPLKHNSYNLEKIYEKIKANDIDVSREYLKSRGISEYLIQELDSQKLLLHNRSKMRSYCCFVVKDESGEVRCLDNHEIGGDKKFVLGEKRIFSLDWSILRISEKIFITEGIIDYLSIKVLEGRKIPGFALMGNVPIFEPELLPKVKTIISALDLDSSGLSGNLDLRNLFPMTEIVRYDMEEHKDPNELLKAIKAQKRTNLSPETKLKLFQEFLVSENKSELAKKWGVDRSYMYEIVRECEESITAGFKEKKPGRRPNGKPVTLDEAWERIQELERERDREAHDRELYYVRSEFLKLRLKWAEIEAAEARGEKVDYENPNIKKSQVKKKRKKRR